MEISSGFSIFNSIFSMLEITSILRSPIANGFPPTSWAWFSLHFSLHLWNKLGILQHGLSIDKSRVVPKTSLRDWLSYLFNYQIQKSSSTPFSVFCSGKWTLGEYLEFFGLFPRKYKDVVIEEHFLFLAIHNRRKLRWRGYFSASSLTMQLHGASHLVAFAGNTKLDSNNSVQVLRLLVRMH